MDAATHEQLILIADDAAAPDVIGALEATFPTAERRSENGRITYFDTFDARLHTAGLGLRSNGSGGLILTTLDGRVVAECADCPAPGFAWDLPEGPVRDAVEPVIEMRRLLRTVEIERTVKTVRILDTEDKTVVRVRCENGIASAAGGNPVRHVLPPVVRITPVKGYPRPLDRVLGLLERDLHLEQAPLDEVSLALHAVGRAPAPPEGPVVLDPTSPAEEAVRSIYARLLEVIRHNEAGTRDRLDTEFLHDFRVAVRRIRALLSQVKGVMPAADVEPFRAEFKWLAGITSPARDADVYLLKLPVFRATLPEKSRGDLAPLEMLLLERQRAAYRVLAETLVSPRYRALLCDWSEYLQHPIEASDAAPNAARPVQAVACERIRRVARRVLRDGSAIDDDTPAEALHELRLVCKKLRYLIDAFSGLYERDEIVPVRRTLKKLQDNLGDFNDCELQQDWLTSCAREIARATPTPVDTLLAMGRLEDRLQIGQAEARRRFAACFARFGGKANRRRLDHLFPRKRARP